MRARFGSVCLVACALACAWSGCSGKNDAAPADAASVDAEDASGSACPDGHATLALVGEFQDGSLESVIACPNGDVFVTKGWQGEVWRFPGGAAPPERYASRAGANFSGVACDEHNRLYVGTFRSFQDGAGAGGVIRFDTADAPGVDLPAQIGGTTLLFVNGLVVVPSYGVYVADSVIGAIVRYAETDPDTYATSIQVQGAAYGPDLATTTGGVNDLAYDPVTNRLCASISATHLVTCFDIDAAGQLANPTQVWSRPEVVPDGIVFDDSGALFVAGWNTGQVLRISNGAEDVIASVPHPAGIAIQGRTLLITAFSLASRSDPGGLYSYDLGACGSPGR